MECRTCNQPINTGMDIFIHNLMDKCKEDAAEEFLDQLMYGEEDE